MSKCKVDICCGPNKPDGFIGVDIHKGPNVDIVHDLNLKFPFNDDSVDYLRAFDAIEHLHNKIHTMNEIWRICKPDAIVEILVPSTDGRGAFQDPTHVSYWNFNSFQYYNVENPGGLQLCRNYGFKGAFRIEKIYDISREGQMVHTHVILRAVKREKVSIIMPVFNQLNYTKNIIENIKCTTQNYEIIVIDNGSNKDTQEYLLLQEDVIVIRNEENLGVAKAWNQGIKRATCNMLVFLNNDIILPRKWLDKMLQCHSYFRSIGVKIGTVGPLCNTCWESLKDVMHVDVSPQNVEEVNSQLEEKNNQYSASYTANTINGSCFLVDKKVFEEVGLFCEDFDLAFFEDTLFCDRLRGRGYCLAVDSKTATFHYRGGTVKNLEKVDPLELTKKNEKLYNGIKERDREKPAAFSACIGFLKDTKNRQELEKVMSMVSEVPGHLDLNQIILLYSVGKLTKGEMVEIGSWKGRSTICFCLANDFEKTKLHCVDHFKGSEEINADNNTLEEFKNNLNHFGVLNKVIIQKKESKIAAFEYPNEFFDTVFIDGAHDYNNVRIDILCWYSKLKTGGLMCGHDYQASSVADAVRDVVWNTNNFVMFDVKHNVWGAIKI